MDQHETTLPSFTNRTFQQEKFSATFLKHLFYALPDDLIYLPYSLNSLWKKASEQISSSSKHSDLEDFLTLLLKTAEVKKNKNILKELELYKDVFIIPRDEGILRLRLFIGREKKKLLRILSNLDLTSIEKLQTHFCKKKIPPFFGEKFFTELYLYKGLKEALLMPPGASRTNLQGTLFQLAMWDGFTRYAVRAMRDLKPEEMRVIFLEYVESLFEANTENALEQALIFIDLLLSDERVSLELKRGALLNGVKHAFNLERGDLAYLFASILERDNQPYIHLLNLKQQITDGEVERAFDYYDSMIPNHEELIEHFFDFDLSASKRIVEEIASRCEGLSNGPLRNRCIARLVRHFILHGDVDSALDLVCELPCGTQRDLILHTSCSMLLVQKKLQSLIPFLQLLSSENRQKITTQIEGLIGTTKDKELIKKFESLKSI